MYRLTKNIYFYIYLILKNETYQSNVWSEFTRHNFLSKKRDNKLTQEEGEGLKFSGNAHFRKRKPLLHKGSSASNNCVLMRSFRQKESRYFFFPSFTEHQLRGRENWAVKCAGIVSKPFQVSKSTKWFWSLSKCLKWLLYKIYNAQQVDTYSQPLPIQLCFVSSVYALVHKAVQKPEPMTRDY